MCGNMYKNIRKVGFLMDKKFQNIQKHEYKNLDTFHNAVRPVFSIAQCFGLMPLVGIRNSDPYSVKFSIKSLQMLITIVFLCLGTFIALSYIYLILPIGIDAKNTVIIFFFLCGLGSCTCFCFLARKWPSLIAEWTKVDLIFLFKPYEVPKCTLSSRIKYFSFIIISMSIIEHCLFQISTIYTFDKYVHTCNTSYTFSYKDYLIKTYRHGFEFIPFNMVFSIVFLYMNWSFTFIWNYLDLFIIMISIALAFRFEQLNTRVNKLNGKIVPVEIWEEIREHYVTLCELLENVDENISAIILFSCWNNLYFICYQFLNIFNKLRYTINYVYFWFSLLYLIIRTICLFLCAASINDQSKLPLKTLRSVPNDQWCSEIDRLTFLMTTQCVSLSGSKFFFLTRKLLFGMAGTIVTYELVLIQFDEKNRIKGMPELC